MGSQLVPGLQRFDLAAQFFVVVIGGVQLGAQIVVVSLEFLD